MKRKNHLWTIIYTMILCIFTTYSLLDTFVITRVYAKSETAAAETTAAVSSQSTVSDSSADTAGNETPDSTDTADSAAETDTSSAAAVQTDGLEEASVVGSYSQDGVNITVTEYRSDDTSVYVADVVLDSADSLQTALADDSFGKNVTEKTSVIAESVNAVLAINGDFYGAQETGYVIRNGVLYRSTASADAEDLVIYKDGTFGIINESDITAEELISNGAQQVLSFGPALVQDGSISVTQDEEVGKAMESNPRTAIGIIDDLHYVFVVSDGRTSESEGLTLYQLAQFMDTLGCTTAYNLDGGGSSTMYFNGEVVNNPTTSGRKISERKVSDIVYIG